MRRRGIAALLATLVLLYAIVSPAILALVLAEFLYCLHQRNAYYAFDDSIANFATAISH